MRAPLEFLSVESSPVTNIWILHHCPCAHERRGRGRGRRRISQKVEPCTVARAMGWGRGGGIQHSMCHSLVWQAIRCCSSRQACEQNVRPASSQLTCRRRRIASLWLTPISSLQAKAVGMKRCNPTLLVHSSPVPSFKITSRAFRTVLSSTLKRHL